jgi:hypothetical protein
MEITGYKYTTEIEAKAARQQCASYYGLPAGAEDLTIYWVDYLEAFDDSPIFWYIEFNKTLSVVLGSPTTFEVNLPTF